MKSINIFSLGKRKTPLMTNLFDKIFYTIDMIFINCCENRSNAVFVCFLRTRKPRLFFFSADEVKLVLFLHWYSLRSLLILLTLRPDHNLLHSVVILYRLFVHWSFWDSKRKISWIVFFAALFSLTPLRRFFIAWRSPFFTDHTRSLFSFCSSSDIVEDFVQSAEYNLK